MWEVTLETQKSEVVEMTFWPRQLNKNWNSKFIQKKASILEEIKKYFLNTWPLFTEKLIKKNLEKPMNMTMGNLHMRR